MPKRKMPEPYRIADEEIAALTKRILRETAQTKRRLSLLNFDELNVLKETDALYETFGQDCRMTFGDIYRLRYEEVLLWLEKKEPPIDEVDELVELWLTEFLNEPNAVLHYAFDTESIRKRDRAIEAVNSVPTKVQKQVFLDKNVRYYIQMASWYTDMASQDAEQQALKDAGIKKVKWNIYGDDHVCKPCYDRNGKIYDIDKVPPRIHPRCRCYLTPA